MIHSLELEKQFLGALLKYPELYSEYSSIISEKDFCVEKTKVHKTIFLVVKNILEKGESLDSVVVSQRIKELGISFQDKVDVYDYIESLMMRSISRNSVLEIAKDLKKYTIRREIYEAAKSVAQEMTNLSSEKSFDEIIRIADSCFNNQIDLYENGEDKPTELGDDIDEYIEYLGDNPNQEVGFMGPFKRVNEIYGSILKPGNIACIVARSGGGKSTISMQYATFVCEKYDVPVLHFDNGEMSKRELQIRQTAAIANISSYLIESGRWRQAGDDIVKRVREAYSKVKNLKFYYYNVGGKSVDEMCNILRRFYYSKVGRGNKMVFSFDYIKTSHEGGGKNEWETVGMMVDKFKKTIHKEIVYDGEPMISMMTSVQANRSGVVNSNRPNSIVDDESIVSLSDRITQFCSHMILLRKKILEEIAEDGEKFGTHKLVFLKTRHLGKDYHKHLDPVRLSDGEYKNNYISLKFENFGVVECGDLHDIVASQNINHNLSQNSSSDIPDFT